MVLKLPISWKEIQQLRKRLEELQDELEKYGAELWYAEYKPRPSDLFEYFVLYNAALALEPMNLKVGIRQPGLRPFTRGDFRSTGWLPFAAIKSHKTLARMGLTLSPSIVISKNEVELAFWFDKSLAKGLRPDIVIRSGHFEYTEEYGKYARLFRDGDIFAEYGLGPAPTENKIYKVETTSSIVDREEAMYFRAKKDFEHPPLIIECKSFGARLGNPQRYADYAKTVLIVSPEKLYEPKASNIRLVRVEHDYNNFDLRSKLRPFLNYALATSVP